jgi:hypothetical protein
MRKLFTLKKGLVAAGLGVAVLGISAGSAFASPAPGQGAQKVALVSSPTSENVFTGPTGGTPSAHSFIINQLSATTGNLTTTIHLQNADPNSMYVAYVFDQNGWGPSGPLNTVLVFTDSQGSADAVSVVNDPTATQAVVMVKDFHGGALSTLDAPVTPLIAS